MTVPPTLKEPLIQEAHLHLSRETIRPVLARLDNEYQVLETRKPWALASRNKQEAHAHKLAELEAKRAQLREGLAKLDQVEERLAQHVTEEGENFCRSTFPEYLEMLAIRKHREDWTQWLERFTEKVATLTRALGTLRNMVCTGYSREEHTYSPFAIQALPPAIHGALEVEAEIKFANEISRLQEQVLNATGMQTAALPRLPEVEYSDRVDQIMKLPLVQAQPQFEKIIDEVKKMFELGIPLLREQADKAGDSQEEILHGFVTQKLDEMRQLIAPEINPQETDQRVAESESRYAATK